MYDRRVYHCFTDGIILGKSGQSMCVMTITPQLWHDVKPQLMLSAKRTEMDGGTNVMITYDATPQLWHDVTPQLRLSVKRMEMDGWWN